MLKRLFKWLGRLTAFVWRWLTGSRATDRTKGTSLPSANKERVAMQTPHTYLGHFMDMVITASDGDTKCIRALAVREIPEPTLLVIPVDENADLLPFEVHRQNVRRVPYAEVRQAGYLRLMGTIKAVAIGQPEWNSIRDVLDKRDLSPQERADAVGAVLHGLDWDHQFITPMRSDDVLLRTTNQLDGSCGLSPTKWNPAEAAPAPRPMKS